LYRLTRSPIISIKESRELDKYSIETLEIPSSVLMEEAAQRLYCKIRKLITKDNNIMIIAGEGNNGGDALSIARKLYFDDYRFEVYIYKPKSIKVGSLFETHLNILNNLNIKTKDLIDNFKGLEKADLIIDGLFGTGYRYSETADELINKINKLQKKIVSIDIPSGLNQDSDGGICADRTLTIGYRKDIFYNTGLRKKCGRITNIPLSFKMLTDKPRYNIINKIQTKQINNHFVNKYSRGALLAIGGSDGMYGAINYSIKAAYSSGAGIVCLLTDKETIQQLNPLIPEAIIDQIDNINNYIPSKYTTTLIGPGLKESKNNISIITNILKMPNIKHILDASFFSMFKPEILNEIPITPILTPHSGEFCRFFGIDPSVFRSNTLSILSETSSKYRSYILLKDTFLALSLPDGRINIYDKQFRAAAQAGSGDIISGTIAGLLAQSEDYEYSIYRSIELFYKAINKISKNKNSYDPFRLINTLRKN